MIGTSENVKKGSIAAAMFVLAACLVAVAFSQHSSTDTSGDEGRIKRVVREAKARGDTEVTLSPPIPLPTGVSSVDEVGDFLAGPFVGHCCFFAYPIDSSKHVGVVLGVEAVHELRS